MTKREKCLTILIGALVTTGIVSTSIAHRENDKLKNANTALTLQYTEVQEENVDKNNTNLILAKENKDLTDNNVELINKIDELTQQIEDETVKKAAEEAKAKAQSASISYVSSSVGGNVLTPARGAITDDFGHKETYYNLDMSGVVRIMRNMGFSEAEYPYSVRADGAKMLGQYVMVAANLGLYPRGSVVMTSLGAGLVSDTGGFATNNPQQFDIATAW